ncbi:MAG: hypothetical protein GY925_00305 [Actinomycetia bacterium]|nr:hypothetical protein [Actinomycetes bacterium]
MRKETIWRVQAHWRVGDESRSYAPVLLTSRRDAERAADEMRDTLSHFVGLEVSVEQVLAEQAATGSQARDRSPVIHASTTQPLQTVCGADADTTSAVLHIDFFDLTFPRACPNCVRLLTQ